MRSALVLCVIMAAMLLICVAARESAMQSGEGEDAPADALPRDRLQRSKAKRSMRFPRSKGADGSWRDDDESPPLGVQHDGFEARRDKRSEERKQRHAARRQQFEERHKRTTERREKMREQKLREREARRQHEDA